MIPKRVPRDRFVDSWRGIFHIILLIDHLPFVFPSLFVFFSALFSPFGYFSVAEGFVFLSGFVSALVYTRVGREQGKLAVWRKAMIRARNIYICYVSAVIMLLALAKFISEEPLKWGLWAYLVEQPLPTAFAKVATLIYQPTFLEILPMYALFLIVTPIILDQLEKEKYLLVGISSLLVWGFAQFGLREELLKLLPASLNTYFGYFNSFAWQILFVSGLICGHKTYTAQTSWLPTDWKLPVLAYITALVFFSFRHNFWGVYLAEKWVGGATLGPLRLLNTGCLIFLVCCGREQIQKCIAWDGFAFLSKYSLQVFAFHLFPIYICGLVIVTRTSISLLMQIAVLTFCILGLFVIALISKLIKNWFSAQAQSKRT